VPKIVETLWMVSECDASSNLTRGAYSIPPDPAAGGEGLASLLKNSTPLSSPK